MNQIITVPDIAIVKTVDGTKKLLSLRDQKVKKDTLRNFGVGSGVKHNGDLYVLEEDREIVMRVVTTNNTISYEINASSLVIDWGDGTKEQTDSMEHSYTDGLPEHEIVVWGFKDSIKALWANYGGIKQLDVSNSPNITTLEASSNKIESLDVSKNTKLSTLNVASNSLVSIDLSHNTELDELSLQFNSVESLDVSKNTKLSYLRLYGNPLVTNQENLIALVNTLPQRDPADGATIQISNTASATWIQDICAAKNWAIK